MEKYSEVLLDNGFFTELVKLETPLTAEEIAARYPGGQSAGKAGQMRVAVSVDEETLAFTRAYLAERDQARYITQRPLAYEEKSFRDYCCAADMLYVIHQWGFAGPKSLLTAADGPMIELLKRSREKLVQTGDPEKDIWYIWDKDMPCAEDAADRDWRYAFDAPDYRPFLIPYLVEDQAKVVGNIVMVSGGGDSWRSNTWEGYPAAKRFREMGYNCFLLQRRVEPYTRLDAAMDLQRSIRYVRYHAKALHISGTDRMAVCGFSGGGGTILNLLAHCYGATLPEANSAGYISDEIDRVDSSVDTAIIIYGVKDDYLAPCVEGMQKNPDLPALFMVVGQDDFADMDLGSLELYKLFKAQVPVELHVLARTVHGFGVGACNVNEGGENFNARVVNTESWPALADTFMKLRRGQMERYERL